MKAIYEWWHYRDGKFTTGMTGIGVVVVGLFVLMYIAAKADAEQWEAYRVKHECRVVGTMRGDTSVGVGLSSNGQVTTVVTTTSDKTGYACNNGLTYWR